jgi:hypothetical protein
LVPDNTTLAGFNTTIALRIAIISNDPSLDVGRDYGSVVGLLRVVIEQLPQNPSRRGLHVLFGWHRRYPGLPKTQREMPMDQSRCPTCKKRLIAMTDRTGRTNLVCLKCDDIDPIKTDAAK